MPQNSGSTRDSKTPIFKAELKVPGGKMLRATCIVRNSNIELVKITGDFFLHPEEDLEGLEEEIKGTKAEEAEVSKVTQAYFAKRKTNIIGAKPKDFVNVITKALQ